MEVSGGEAPLKFFSLTLEKCVGHSLKIWSLPDNTSPPLVSQAGYVPRFNQDEDWTIITK